MIALGIISIAAVGLSNVMAAQVRSAKDVDVRFTKAEVANSMIVNIDCAETIYQACRLGNRRLYSQQGPLQLSIPYQVDRKIGVALDVRCEGSLVVVRYSTNGERGEEVVPGGVCKQRFGVAAKCQRGTELSSFDEELGKIKCTKKGKR